MISKRRRAAVTAVAVVGMAVAAMAHAAGGGSAPDRPLDPGAADARRASAARLLDASRFRDRQAVLLPDAVRTAQADLVTECVDRASDGRSLTGCRQVAGPGSPTSARLTSRRSDMLDEIMAASQTIYARRFTPAEMDEITRFFKTPVGRKYGEQQPGVLAEVQARKAAIARKYLIEASRNARPTDPRGHVAERGM